MKKLIALTFALTVLGGLAAFADDNAYFSVGPLSLNVPLKTTRLTNLYDFHSKQDYIGGETPVLTLWDRVEGTVGAVTSLQGSGTPFIGGNVLLGNLLANYISLPNDLAIGGFGGYNFRDKAPMYGLKASMKLW